MFFNTITIKKPLNLKVKVANPNTDVAYTRISSDDGFHMIFEDLETLNDFVQILHGMALTARDKGQL